MKALGLAIALTALLATPALPQSADPGADSTGKSVEELQELFLKQKSRGLRILPSAAAPATTAATAGATAVTPAPQTPAPTPTDYAELPEDEQVFVQISFDFDSAALREDQKPKLATLCQAMQAVDVAVFRVVGHTDASGSADYNRRLSVLRAEEVKRHLVGSCGIAADRLEAVGMGEQFPLAGTDPEADENRRVEFQALS